MNFTFIVTQFDFDSVVAGVTSHGLMVMAYLNVDCEAGV